MCLISVQPAKVDVHIDTKGIEANLRNLATCQGRELPKIRNALEVLSGIKPQKVAQLEARSETIMNRLNVLTIPFTCDEALPPAVQKEYEELENLLQKIEEEIAHENKKWILGEELKNEKL